MNDTEKRNLAIQRELEELQKVARSFATLAADAQRFTEELNASFRRMDAIREEAELDRAIDELDYLMARGDYAYLREAREVSNAAPARSNLERQYTAQKFLRKMAARGKFVRMVK